ncbi:MAG TPA: hypothetical protein VHJ20_21440 [Polyangia bacterium]|nr:hypothetical protein [Polyangia bacterium]
MATSRLLPPVDKRGVLVFVVAIAVLLVPWPFLGRAFATVFSGYANVVTRVFDLGGDAEPRFSVPPRGRASTEDGGDWAVALAGRDAPADQAMLLDTRVLGYTPVAVLLALAVASRLPRRRRLLVLALASACLLARAAAAIALPVARAFDADRTGWAFGTFAEVVWFGAIMPPAMSYATPLVAWWIGFALTTENAVPAPAEKPREKSRRTKRRRS